MRTLCAEHVQDSFETSCACWCGPAIWTEERPKFEGAKIEPDGSITPIQGEPEEIQIVVHFESPVIRRGHDRRGFIPSPRMVEVLV